MNARVAGVLLVLLLALGGGALILKQQNQSRRPASADTLGQPILKGLQAASIAAIAIREPGATLTLQRKEQQWTIAERGAFPADIEKVRELVLKALELKVGQSEPIADADRARLNLDDKGTQLEFRGADGKPLAQLVIGRKFFRREPENADRAPGDGRFVMLPGDPKTVHVVADPLAAASAKSANWISRAGFAAEKVKTMEVSLAGGERWNIQRPDDNADWKLSPLRAGEKLDVIRANSASYSLNSVELADVAAPGLQPADSGLDRPAATIVASTFDGLTYTVRLGKRAGDNVHASVAIAGDANPGGPDAAERARKIAARLPGEKALAAHTLLIAASKFEDILKKRAELLEGKETGKKQRAGRLSK
ncbi:MAG: DUF4340 domain-containing protein [Proteobacteria bacterium]|nr:DUF4340 domain-containing protein [Pseudomonadota bacterium]